MTDTKNSRNKKRRPVLRGCCLGCTTLLILAGVFIGWIAFSLMSGPDAMEINEFHPFRSAGAKVEYLEHYDKRAEKWPVVSENRLVETSFGSTFIRVSGPIDAPPLVLLPGGGATSLIWRPNIEALSEQYRTYAVDNIYDFGRSIYSRTMTQPADITAWLDELFTALDLGDSINLAGYSYGGWMTSQYALHAPDRLRKIVMIAPASTVKPLSGEMLGRSAICVIPLRLITIQ